MRLPRQTHETWAARVYHAVHLEAENRRWRPRKFYERLLERRADNAVNGTDPRVRIQCFKKHCEGGTAQFERLHIRVLGASCDDCDLNGANIGQVGIESISLPRTYFSLYDSRAGWCFDGKFDTDPIVVAEFEFAKICRHELSSLSFILNAHPCGNISPSVFNRMTDT